MKSRLAAPLGLALVALAALAGPAAAAPGFPGAGPAMSLVFHAETARVVGDTALVPVRCLGSREGLCSGTVTLAVDGRRHKAPFSVPGGGGEDLAIPVGPAGELSGKRAIAVARTAQPADPFSRSTAVIHFR